MENFVISIVDCVVNDKEISKKDYTRFKNSLFKRMYGKRMGGNSYEDIISEALLKMKTHCDKDIWNNSCEGQKIVYFFKVFRNTLIHFYNKETYNNNVMYLFGDIDKDTGHEDTGHDGMFKIEYIDEGFKDLNNDIANKEIIKTYRDVIHGLSDKNKKIMYYYFIVGLTQSEISKRVGLSQQRIQLLVNKFKNRFDKYKLMYDFS